MLAPADATTTRSQFCPSANSNVPVPIHDSSKPGFSCVGPTLGARRPTGPVEERERSPGHALVKPMHVRGHPSILRRSAADVHQARPRRPRTPRGAGDRGRTRRTEEPLELIACPRRRRRCRRRDGRPRPRVERRDGEPREAMYRRRAPCSSRGGGERTRAQARPSTCRRVRGPAPFPDPLSRREQERLDDRPGYLERISARRRSRVRRDASSSLFGIALADWASAIRRVGSRERFSARGRGSGDRSGRPRSFGQLRRARAAGLARMPDRSPRRRR